MERISTGIEGLDKLLFGGLPEGRTIMASGSCGCGKSILAAHFIYDGVKKNESCVYITLEEKKEKLVEDLKEVGIDFEKAEKTGKLQIIGGSVGFMKYFKEKSNAGVSDLAFEIREIITKTKASRFVLDSINLYTMLFETDIERRRALVELVSVLEEHECTAILTCEIKEGDNGISWYGFEDFVVDGVIVLYRVPFENMYERAISIVKMRGISHSQNKRALVIKDEGIVVYPDQEPFHMMGTSTK